MYVFYLKIQAIDMHEIILLIKSVKNIPFFSEQCFLKEYWLFD